MNKGINEQRINGLTDGRTDRQKNEQANNRRMDGWMDESIIR